MTPEQLHFSAGRFTGKVTDTGFNGVSVLTEGIAQGHSLSIDGVSLRSAHAILYGRKLAAYLTHADAMGDRLGSEIGFASNFRIDGRQLRADFTFLDSFMKHEPAEHGRLVEMAQLMPDQFGLSVVFRALKVWPLSNGEELPADGPRPSGATTEFPAVRFASFESVDFVRAPAANVGLFKTPKPDASAPAPVAGSFAEQLAAKDREISALSAQIELLTRERDEARVFDIRHTGVRAADLPDMSHARTGTDASTDDWSRYEKLRAKDPASAQNFYDRHLRVHGRQS